MNICCIGRDFRDDSVKDLNIDSTQTLLDFDAAIIDLDGLYKIHIAGNLNPRSLEKRRNEISEFLALGRTIVVFAYQFQFEVLLPIKINPVASRGSRMDFKGPNELKEFWSSIRHCMEYQAYWHDTCGQPFVFVSEINNRSVATWVKHGRGNLFILPSLAWDYNPNYSYYRVNCVKFIGALKKLITHLTPKKSDFLLPSWSSQYGWQRENELRKNLVSLQRQATELERELETKSQELDAEDKLKILFTAKGDVLADAVIDVFRQLGAKAEPGEPGRDDIIIEFEGKHAVVEVKGRNGSGAEKDIAQLQKWVSISFADREIDAKGILLVNAFCDTPVAERSEQAFPDQMLKLAQKYEHCLLTTTQLLGLLLEVRVNPEKRANLVDSLFSTVGIYEQFSDWQKFLTSPTVAPSKTDA